MPGCPRRMDVPKQLSVLQKKFTDSSSRSSIMIVAALRRALLVAAASSEGMDVSLVAPLLLTVIVTTHAVASAACVSARTINRHLAASDTPRVAAAVLTDTELDSTVAKQIDKLGSNYWVRMIIGALMAAHPQSTFSRKEEGGCVHGTARPDGSRSSPDLGPEAHRAWRVPRAQLHALRCLVRQRRLRRVARRRRHAVPPTLPSVMSPEVADHETRYAESSNLKHET